MGSVGANTIFYNTGQFEGFSTDPNGAIEFNYAAFALDQGFNRRQEHIIQYWSPNVNGFVFRYAQTAGSRDETPGPDGDLDPVIRSTSLAYENGPFWAAATYQEHEDWAAAGLGGMESSDAESYRFAARYIMDLGDGMSVQISAMYEDLEYEFRGATGSSSTVIDRDDEGNPIQAVERHSTGEPVLIRTEMGEMGATTTIPRFEEAVTTGQIALGNNVNDESREVTEIPMRDRLDDEGMPIPVLDVNGEQEVDSEGNPRFERERVPVYQMETILDDTGIADAMAAFGYRNFVSSYAGTAASLGNGSITFERDAFLISGKIKFGGPLDLRFSYMDADDLEISCAACVEFNEEVGDEWGATAADAWNVGLYYTMPAGTELRLTYSEVSNDANGTYGQGISGTGLGTPGGEVEMIAFGIVHWFD
jgi:predicted porin